MTPTLTPMWHADQRWVPLEVYESLSSRISKLEAAGDALAILHLSQRTMEESIEDSEQWIKAKKDAQ